MSKTALCIGINDYPGTRNDLAGCVNDANDWAAALAARNFVIVKLLDAQASRAALLDAMSGLVGSAARGDTVVITYSGHGTWVPDKSGNEADAREEGLCPWDIGSGKVLLDDEIASIFAGRAAGVRVLLISDCCHSGGVTRGSDGELDPEMPRARFMPPSAWMKAGDIPDPQIARRPVRGGLTRSGANLLLAACSDVQYSWDTRFKSRPNGAFTYYALKALAGLPAAATYADWFNAISPAYLPSNRLPQDPQLFGTRAARNCKVFE